MSEADRNTVAVDMTSGSTNYDFYLFLHTADVFGVFFGGGGCRIYFCYKKKTLC